MEFIVVDKNTIENITDKKKWILGPNGDLEYIDMFGNICSSADAIAVAPETYYTLLKHKRDNITNTWILTDRSFFIASNIYGEFETKATIYLDANLYITGTGTKENPYSLYSIIK